MNNYQTTPFICLFINNQFPKTQSVHIRFDCCESDVIHQIFNISIRTVFLFIGTHVLKRLLYAVYNIPIEIINDKNVVNLSVCEWLCD